MAPNSLPRNVARPRTSRRRRPRARRRSLRRACGSASRCPAPRTASVTGRRVVAPCEPWMRLRMPVRGGRPPRRSTFQTPSSGATGGSVPSMPGPNVPFPPMEAQLVPPLPERRLAVRAEVGRLPRRPGERRRRARALVAQRTAAAALLPGAASARRSAPAPLRPRRRDRDLARRRAGLRLDADAAPPGRVAHSQAVGRDSGASSSSSTCCCGTASRCGSSHSRSAAPASTRSTAGFGTSPCTRDAAAARAWLDRFESMGLDGVVAKKLGLPYLRARATAW